MQQRDISLAALHLPDIPALVRTIRATLEVQHRKQLPGRPMRLGPVVLRVDRHAVKVDPLRHAKVVARALAGVGRGEQRGDRGV